MDFGEEPVLRKASSSKIPIKFSSRFETSQKLNYRISIHNTAADHLAPISEDTATLTLPLSVAHFSSYKRLEELTQLPHKPCS